MMALASTTAMAMPLEDLQLSTKTWVVAFDSEVWGFGSACFFTMLLQPEIGAGFALGVGFWSWAGTGAVASSMVVFNEMGDRGG